MSHFVVDASVVIAWFVPERYSEAAARLFREEHTLSAPDLLVAEIGNALWKKVRRREIAGVEGMQILTSVTGPAIELHRSVPLVSLAFRIATETGATLYDSLYVSLAVPQDSVLVTADRGLIKSLGAGFLARYLTWVEQVV